MSTWMQTLFENKPLMIGLGLVAILIGALLLLMIVKMLFGGKLRLPGGRTRQARLGIVDAFDLDRQRQLIIVRRDNTEHLIMIGGPNDLLIESEILRVEARETRENRRDKIEAPGPTLPGFAEPRIPAPFAAPERVEPETRPVEAPPPVLSPSLDRPVMPPPLPPAIPSVRPPEPVAPPLQVEPAAEPTAPLPRRVPTFPLPPRRPSQAVEPRPAPVPRPQDSVTRTEPAAPSFDLTPAPVPSPPPETAPTPPVSPAAQPPATRPAPNFLRPLPPRPVSKILPRTTPVPSKPSVEPVASPVIQAPVAPSPAPPKPVQAAPPPPAPTVAESQRDTLESLEEEMAKLLGRGGDS